MVATLSSGNFAPYPAHGGSIEFLQRGVKSASDMFAYQQSVNTTLTWFIRIGAFVIMYVALSLMTRIFVTIGEWEMSLQYWIFASPARERRLDHHLFRLFSLTFPVTGHVVSGDDQSYSRFKLYICILMLKFT